MTWGGHSGPAFQMRVDTVVTTILVPPWPWVVDWGDPAIYNLDGSYEPQRYAVLTFGWGFSQAALHSQLLSFPQGHIREVDVYAPLESASGTLQSAILQYGWWRGRLVRPAQITTLNRKTWAGPYQWRLTNARVL